MSCSMKVIFPTHLLLTILLFESLHAECQKSDKTIFSVVPKEKTGVTFINTVHESITLNFWNYTYAFNGSGVSLADMNNDGLPDIFFTSSCGDNTLYLNKGNLKFEDISVSAGIKTDGFCTGITHVDINADGWMDYYVSRSFNPIPEKRSNLLYINNHDLTFSESAATYGLQDSKNHHSQANFFDFDLDGDLDVYVLNYPTDWDDKGKFSNYQKIEKGVNESDQFYINNGNGTFTNISKTAGINDHAYGLSCTAGDVNMDGYPDLFIGNDFAMPDFLYINHQHGGFTDQSRTMLDKTSWYGMGSDIADFNNDTYPDIICVDMRSAEHVQQFGGMEAVFIAKFEEMYVNGYFYQYGRNTLHLNNGNGNFSEVANMMGMAETEWSWSPLMVDFDNDGWRDVFISNGYYLPMSEDTRDYGWKLKGAVRNNDSTEYWKLRKELIEIWGREHYTSKNCFFKNVKGLNFTCSPEMLDDTTATVAYGAAYADLDNDGDLDMVVSNTNAAATLYKNNTAENNSDNHYLRIKFKGNSPNLFGIGASVMLEIGDQKMIGENYVVRGYLSSSENTVHFGVGTAKQIDKLIVTWPNGKIQVMENIKTDQVVMLDQTNATIDKVIAVKPASWFTEITAQLKLNLKHIDREFKDYQRELLLPHKLSQYGPALAVADMNGDGLEDFVMGNGAGNTPKFYFQKSTGGFDLKTISSITSVYLTDDMGMLLFDADSDGDNDLYIGKGSNEAKEDNPVLLDKLFLNDGTGNFTYNSAALPNIARSTSTVNAADYDMDGDLDLFIGVRCIPGKYPQPGSSYILKNNGGIFSDVTLTVAPMLKDLGMITSALWTDYDNDNDLDLMIVGEWMPITVLQNNAGIFTNKTSEYQLENSSGWWNSITGGDFDNDGDIDYVAGNYGRNFRFPVTEEEPLNIWSGDWDKNGSQDMVMAFYDDGKVFPTKARRWSIEQIPSLTKKFATYKDFATASLEEVYGKTFLDTALHYQAMQFRSCYIRNDGAGKFAITPLPDEAQISSVYGMCTGDYNADGNLDLLLHGNFYPTEVEIDRMDAGIGLLMTGDGNGNFSALTPDLSGFVSPDDAKSLVQIYDQNQNMTIIAASNNGPAHFFKLINGAEMKTLDANNMDCYSMIYFKDGSVRKNELYYGSGYLSQTSRKLFYPASLIKKIEMVDFAGNKKEL